MAGCGGISSESSCPGRGAALLRCTAELGLTSRTWTPDQQRTTPRRAARCAASGEHTRILKLLDDFPENAGLGDKGQGEQDRAQIGNRGPVHDRMRQPEPKEAHGAECGGGVRLAGDLR